MAPRKAESSLLGLIDSDIEEPTQLSDDDILQSPEAIMTSNVKKPSRAKPKAKANKVTKPRAPARKPRADTAAGAKKAGARKPSGPKRKALEEQVNDQDMEAVQEDGAADEEIRETIELQDDVSEDDRHSASEAAPPKGQPTKKTGKKANAETMVTQDGEFEYTPTIVRQSKLESKSKGRAKKPAVVTKNKPLVEITKSRAVVQEAQADAMEVDEFYVSAGEHAVDAPAVKPTSKATTQGRSESRHKQPTATRRRAGSASDTERTSSDPALRRKLGDMTKKFENVDLKYRNLREVGVTEANANMEKLRKQCDAATNASNDLIASMKKELATQTALAQESRSLRTKLQSRDAETTKLRTQMTDMSANLSGAQNEIKALQAKLAASRNTSVEATSSRAPGSAIKNNGQVRTIMVGSAEAAQAAQVAQLKEDLYSDLTGLILRGVKKMDDGEVYDCIQTGRNGTLHFKLSVAQDGDGKGASFDDAEFEYSPLLDPNRDRDMLELLPDYLTEDITFSRRHAAQFYSRVVETLTKKRAED